MRIRTLPKSRKQIFVAKERKSRESQEEPLPWTGAGVRPAVPLQYCCSHRSRAGSRSSELSYRVRVAKDGTKVPQRTDHEFLPGLRLQHGAHPGMNPRAPPKGVVIRSLWNLCPIFCNANA